MMTTEGIAHNLIFDNIIFLGDIYAGETNRLFMFSSSQNITFSNNKFYDFKWAIGSLGLTQGYQPTALTDCTNAYFNLLYENNTFINSEPQFNRRQLYIANEYQFPNYLTNIIFRGNIFINHTLGVNSLIFLNYILFEYNTWVVLENNHFENIIHLDQGLPMIFIRASFITLRNNTFTNCQLSSGVSVFATEINIEDTKFSKITGIEGPNSLITIHDSTNVIIKRLQYSRCQFENLRALHVQSTQNTSIEDVTIVNSLVSKNHLFYISRVIDFSIANAFVSNITLSDLKQDKTQVIKVYILQPWPNKEQKINFLNITNFTYQNSQMSLFDLQDTSGQSISGPRSRTNLNYPQPGEVFIHFQDSLIEEIRLLNQQQLFTTQNIAYKGMVLALANTTIRNNYVENRYFEFNHEFRMTLFNDSLIENNTGQFLEVMPVFKQIVGITRTVKFINIKFYRNFAPTYGHIHMHQNSFFEARNSEFIENFGLGRGVIVYVEQPNAVLYFLDSLFSKNFGYQGGVLFADNQGSVYAENCNFEKNFAFHGGVGFLQNEGQMRMINSNFYKNFALRASLFHLFNSQNTLIIQSGEIHENGFPYHSKLKIENFINENKLSEITNNIMYQGFLRQNQEVIIQHAQRDQYNDNPQIQIIKASIQFFLNPVVYDQIALMKSQSISNVYIESLTVTDIERMNSSFIFFDQSQVLIDAIQFFNTSICPNIIYDAHLFDIQSESDVVIKNLQILDHEGGIIYVQNSNLSIYTSQLANISFSGRSDHLIKVFSANLYMESTQIKEIKCDFEQKYIMKIRSSQLQMTNFYSEKFNTSFLLSTESQIQIENSSFREANNSHQNGLIINSIESTVNISDTIFEQIQGKLGSAIFFTQSRYSPYQKILTVTRCDFISIKSEIGGAIYISEVQTSIRNSRFINNTAGESGASLYLSCSFHSNRDCQFDVRFNIFTHNTANIKGGAIFYDLFQPLGLPENLFYGNFAPYGSDYASYPTNIKILQQSSWLNSLISGKDIQNVIRVGIYDQNGQLYKIDSKSSCVISSEDLKLSISGDTKVRADNGIYVFKDINMIGIPDYKSLLAFTSNAIIEAAETPLTIPISSSAAKQLIPKYDLSINFRPCISGEVTQNNKCVKCNRGYYSLNPQNSTCDQCLSKAQCFGGTDIRIINGTWRSSNQSILIYNCFVKEACIGEANERCAVGYTGKFCSECQTNGTLYGRSSGSKCDKCSSTTNQLLFLGLFYIFWSIYLLYILTNLLNDPTRYKPQTVLMRILTNYFQVLALVRSFELDWPELVQTWFTYQLKFITAQDNFFSLDCLTKLIPKKIHPYYLQVIIFGLSPFYLVLLSIPVWGLINYGKKLLSRCIPQTESTTSAQPQQALVQQGQNNSFDNNNNLTFNPRQDELSLNEISNLRVDQTTNRSFMGEFPSQNEQKQSPSFQQPCKNESLNLQVQSSMIYGNSIRRSDDNPTRFSIQRSSMQNTTMVPPQPNQIQIEQQIQIIPQEEPQQQYNFREKVMTTFFVITLIWHPQIINYSFSLFMCVDYEDGHSYLRQDTSIRCWDEKNLFLQLSIGLTFILLWGILFPYWIYCQIIKREHQLDETQNLKLYGFFYIGLTDQAFYWEIWIINIRKIILILIATFFSSDKQSFKGYFGILALFLHRQFSHYKMPFIDPRFNDIEHWASIASIFTIFGGIILMPGGLRKQLSQQRHDLISNEETFKIIIFFLVLLLNFVFIVKWIINFAQVLFQVHLKKIKKLFENIRICQKILIKLEGKQAYDDELKERLKQKSIAETKNLRYDETKIFLQYQQKPQNLRMQPQWEISDVQEAAPNRLDNILNEAEIHSDRSNIDSNRRLVPKFDSQPKESFTNKKGIIKKRNAAVNNSVQPVEGQMIIPCENYSHRFSDLVAQQSNMIYQEQSEGQNTPLQNANLPIVNVDSSSHISAEFEEENFSSFIEKHQNDSLFSSYQSQSSHQQSFHAFINHMSSSSPRNRLRPKSNYIKKTKYIINQSREQISELKFESSSIASSSSFNK